MNTSFDRRLRNPAPGLPRPARGAQVAGEPSEARSDTAGGVLLRGGGISAAGYALRLAARLLVVLVAGRLFGATVFGAFTIAAAVVETASVAGGLSTKWVLFKWLDRDARRGRVPAHALLDAVLLVAAASGLLSGLVVALVEVTPGIGESTRLAILYLAPAIMLQALLDLCLAATRWTEVMRYEVVAKSVIQPIVTVLAIVALYALGAHAIGLAWAYIVGTAVALGYAAAATRKQLGGLALRTYRVRPRLLWRRLRSALPTTSSDVVDVLYSRVDIYVVAILLGEHAAGIYGLARQVSMPIRQVRLAFDGMIVPLVSHTLVHGTVSQAGRALASSARLVLVLQLPVLLLLWGFGKPLLQQVGPGFAAGYGAMICLAAAETVQGAFGLGELLLVYARPRLMAALSAAFVALGALAAILLQPLLGLTGIGLSVLLSYGTRALCRRVMLRTLFAIGIDTGLWIGPAVAVGLAVLVVAALWATSSLAAVAFGLAAYAAALIVWFGRVNDRLVPQGFISKAERPAAGQPARRALVSRPSRS